ncbi:MAG TPA: hypothetical protein VJC08_04990 [bacterium]|nr:hypothetical protein [bacterium]
MKNLKNENWYDRIVSAFEKKAGQQFSPSPSPAAALPVLEEWASPEEDAA